MPTAGTMKVDRTAANEDSVMSHQSVRSTTSNASSGRRRRSAARSSFIRNSAQQGEGKNIVWIGGRPMTMPSESAQAFASVPQQSADASIPTQGVTGDEAVNFSLPHHMQAAVGTDSNPPTVDAVQEAAEQLPSPQKFTTRTANTLLDKPHPRGQSWGTHDISQHGTAMPSQQDEANTAAQSHEGSGKTVSAGLGAKLKAQLAALKAESEGKQSNAVEDEGASSSPAAQAEDANAQASGFISPPDSEQGDASETTWTAGMGQNLGNQLRDRLAKAKQPRTTARPPVHPSRPTSEQTWSAGMGTKLWQELAKLRAQAPSDSATAIANAVDSCEPLAPAGPRDAEKFPAQPVPVPWTAPVSEDPEETWSASLGKRMRRQLPRALGNETSLPLPQEKPRPSLFDLFAEQSPDDNQHTWSAGIGARMRKQLEELRQRELEDSAHTASGSSLGGDIPQKRSAGRSVPSSEQTWSAGVSNEARLHLLNRRSVLKRNNSSPDLEEVDTAHEKSKSMKPKSPQKEDVVDFLQHDSLTFHHLEEIPHVGVGAPIMHISVYVYHIGVMQFVAFTPSIRITSQLLCYCKMRMPHKGPAV